MKMRSHRRSVYRAMGFNWYWRRHAHIAGCSTAFTLSFNYRGEPVIGLKRVGTSGFSDPGSGNHAHCQTGQ